MVKVYLKSVVYTSCCVSYVYAHQASLFKNSIALFPRPSQIIMHLFVCLCPYGIKHSISYFNHRIWWGSYYQIYRIVIYLNHLSTVPNNYFVLCFSINPKYHFCGIANHLLNFIFYYSIA